MMRRREFFTLLGGGAAWPVAARAQQRERMRLIGAITGVSESDIAYQARFSAFRQALQQFGWTEGRNVRIDQRFGSAGDVDVVRKHARDLVALAPDVIVAGGSPNVGALQQASRTVPIVFVGVVDPVGAGFVANLARPGGNITGFTSFEYGMAAKWLELLKEVDPRVKRAAVLRDPTSPAGIGLLAAMQGVASSLRVELSPLDARDATEIERGVAGFARGSDCGLIVTLGAFAINHRDLISRLAALVGTVPTSWSIVATGDFNRDSKADIVWRHTDGTVAIWLMSGVAVLESNALGVVPTNWSIIATGDFYAVGISDLLWRDTSTGAVAIWLMLTTADVGDTANVGTVPTDWVIQNVNAN
jgi:ABC transporter substrate binding protein